MFVLIVGGGKVGSYLTRALVGQGHEVVIVEKSDRKARMLEQLLEQNVTVVGDGCDPLVLEQAGLKRADVVIADTGDDEDNLVVCLITKKNSTSNGNARIGGAFAFAGPRHPTWWLPSAQTISACSSFRR